MSLRSLPALFMRGGTSKALVFDATVLPHNLAERDAIILAAMGSPDPFGRQLDGMGGGVSSLSKVCIVGPSSHKDADIDFTFAQVSVTEPKVDYAGNCGNMISAMGPAALIFGHVRAEGAEARIRIHNTNTSRIIVATFPVSDGLLAVNGDLAIDGVAGCAARIRLDFLEPGGAKSGQLLPTGTPIDILSLPDGTRVAATLVDAANPCVFVAAADLEKTATEHPEALAHDAAFLGRMEAIRQAGSVQMGLAPDLPAAARMASLPKIAIVAPPATTALLSGEAMQASEMDLLVRMISMEQPHRAIPITGAICLALACRIDGTIPARLARKVDGPLTLSHPSGSILVDASTAQTSGPPHALSGTVYRTSRLLFSGYVHYRLSATGFAPSAPVMPEAHATSFATSS